MHHALLPEHPRGLLSQELEQRVGQWRDHPRSTNRWKDMVPIPASAAALQAWLRNQGFEITSVTPEPYHDLPRDQTVSQVEASPRRFTWYALP